MLNPRDLVMDFALGACASCIAFGVRAWLRKGVAKPSAMSPTNPRQPECHSLWQPSNPEYPRDIPPAQPL
jgi:hypothetical protein